MSMNNKKTIIIVIVAVVVVAGAYFGYNRWRQQRLANQIMQEVYGVNTGGLLGKITGTGGGNIVQEIAKEAAKQDALDEAQRQKDEAAEAAKTPEDKYNDAAVMETYDANSKAVADEGMAIVESVFGKAKLAAISTAYITTVPGSGVMSYMVPRVTTGADIAAFSKALTNNGLQIMQSGVDNTSAVIMAGNDTGSYMIGFEIGGQEVSMTIMKNTNE